MLNIKRPETYALAKQVAERTGLSLTDAVTEALRDKLKALEGVRPESANARRAKVRHIQRRFRDLPGEPFSSEDIGTILYDSDGLPK